MIPLALGHPRLLPTFAVVLVTAVALFGVVPVGAADPEKILILPFHVSSSTHEKELRGFSEHAYQTIRAAMGQLGGAYVLEPEKKTEQLLRDGHPPATEEEARALAAAAGSDLVIYGFLSGEVGRFTLKGVMWDLSLSKATVSTEMRVNNIHGLPGVLQLFVKGLTRRLHGGPRVQFYKGEGPGMAGTTTSQRFPAGSDLSLQPGPWRSGEMDGAFTSIDAGDMDGDGKRETVIVEPQRVTISRFEQGVMRTLSEFTQTPAIFISAELADLNGDGVSELILCYQTPSGLESALGRYAQGGFQVTARFPQVILRTISDPDGTQKRLLVGQQMDLDDPFTGEMIQFNVSGDGVMPSGKVMLPPGTFLLSFVSGPLGKNQEQLRIILNQDQRLMVFDRDNRLLTSVTDRIYGIDQKIRYPWRGSYREVTNPGRLMIADMNGDGENELLLLKQADHRAMIQALSWDGQSLVNMATTVPYRGIISDFAVRDFKNEGIKSLVFLLVSPSPFPLITNPRSVVFAYDLIP
jgi:hypothetical protein